LHNASKRSDLGWTERDLINAISDGIQDANINCEYPLKGAVKPHQAIESDKTLGAKVLIP